MRRGMTAAQLRGRITRLAARGGDLTVMRTGLDEILRAAIRHDVAAISTTDPATLLWSSCFVRGCRPTVRAIVSR